MATRNLSEYDPEKIPDAGDKRFGIVVSEWNQEITSALADGAVRTLLKHGARKDNIFLKFVPGSFELPLGGQFFAEAGIVDAVLLLGCVIQGETRHFDYICSGVTQGVMDLNLKYNFPFIFGVLTTFNLQQAKDRADGRLGNKGDEAAVTAIKMVNLKRNMNLHG